MFQTTHLSPDWFARQPRLKLAVFAILLAIFLGTSTTQAMPCERLLLDQGWRFSLGSAADPQKDFGYGDDWQFSPTATKMADGGAMDYRSRSQFAKAGQSSPVCGGWDFDDSGWRQVNLPHDWAVELPFDEKADFSHGFKPIGRGYPDNSIGWYRRILEIPKEDLGKRISVEFDGVFRDCTLWINGHFLGRHLSGYSSFHFDVTDYLHYGVTNLLVVRVDATQTEGWFYEGAGIYRHVWLDKTAPLHVAAWGTYVTASVAGQQALVTARARIANESEGEAVAEVVSDILDPQGKPVGKQLRTKVRLQPHEEREISEPFQVKNPTLWSLEYPRQYRLVTTIRRADEVVDRYETPFGIRTIFFDPDHGFFLNGKHVFLKGACFHQNHAGVGTAIPDRLIEYRLQRLQEMGCNAIRSSHYPPTPELLEACDRLGMLVIDEHRLMGSCPEILDQLERLIRRDRNHPSIISWSIGNEEFEIQGNDLGVRIATTMQSLVHRLDSTRPVTVAMDYEWGKGFSSVIDLQGFNYKKKTGKEMDEFHRQFPKKPAFSTEEGCAIGTRGIYTNDSVRGYVSAYDDNKLDFGSTPEEWWNFYLARPWLAGAFIWTGFDYRGAPAPYRWPCINSHIGVMDTCGFPKDSFYYYQSWWTDKPVLHLLPHWNWPGKEGQEIDVRCFSNLEEVELLLNGQSLGRKPMPRNSHLAWLVKYSPGKLEARGYKDGKLVATTTRETAGTPAAIALEPDRATLKADGEDVSVITVSVRDAQGRLVPTADNEITFTISGSGHNIGVGNGNPSSHEPDKAGQRRVFNGLAQLIVQATAQVGSIQVTAESAGLKPAVLRLPAQAAPLRPAVPASASSSPTPR